MIKLIKNYCPSENINEILKKIIKNNYVLTDQNTAENLNFINEDKIIVFDKNKNLSRVDGYVFDKCFLDKFISSEKLYVYGERSVTKEFKNFCNEHILIQEKNVSKKKKINLKVSKIKIKNSLKIFKKLYIMQKNLDKLIYKKLQLLKSEKINFLKTISLIVETSELANEIEFFKYWKTNRTKDSNKILEEFIDGIHFYLSLMNELNCKNYFAKKIVSFDISKQFLAIYESQVKLSKKITKRNLMKSLFLYLGLISFLDISQNEIFKSYSNKNKINKQRIRNNY